MCLGYRPPHRNRPMFREPTGLHGYGGGGFAGFHTSPMELLHLAVALIVLTTAFTFFFGGVSLLTMGRQEVFLDLHQEPLGSVALLSFAALGTGFILHELMHKVVAQFFGHWAEFRAQLFGLLIPIPLALLTPFIFAAPGAVVIAGYVERHQNGIISAAGPLTNLAIGFIALPFTFIPGSVETFEGKLALVVGAVNALLALFNMLPIGILDGRKVWKWNKLAFLAVWALGILLAAMLFPAL